MAHTVTLIPAYGRKYNNRAEALKDWHGGLDFKIAGGPYCSIRDIERLKMLNNHVVIGYYPDNRIDLFEI